VLLGGLLALPAYVAGVAWHEGSHALVAKAYGAEVTELQLMPGRHPRTGAFYFGYTSYRGQLERGEKAMFFLAPRFVDLALLGSYAVLIGLRAQPDNDYAELPLAVLATAAWVDFSKDMLLASPANDLVRFHTLYDRDSEWQRLPWRALHVGLSTGAAYFIAKGYARMLDGDPPDAAAVIVPLARAAF
jgi:hypothetical protein